MAPKMAQPPPHLALGEMRQIVGYLWAEAILQDSGVPADGKNVFAAKNCAICHNDPSTGRRVFRTAAEGSPPFP